MKQSLFLHWFVFVASLAVLVPARAQTVTQTLTLESGWNAVWLEVTPPDNRADSVFEGLPIASVWTRFERPSSVDFIQSVSEEAFNEVGWSRWFPASREEAFLNNLFRVQANHAYLIKSTNAVPFVWELTGRPALRQPEWVPDAYTLRGLPVDPSLLPTFQGFFAASPAHFDPATGQLQPIYRLNSLSGQWEAVAPGDPMQSGTAYWVRTDGASDYLAPLNVDVALGDGLDFGSELTELDLNLENRSASPFNALVAEVPGTNSILSHYTFDAVQGGAWPSLPTPLVAVLDGGEEATVRLGAGRQGLEASTYESVLVVRDGVGSRLWVPVRVENPAVNAGQTQGGGAGGALEPDPHAGLWVGFASLTGVSEVHSGDPGTPTPTRSELNLRLIVHVDASGHARLLKEVLQMWKNGTFTNTVNGELQVDQPGEYVLLTDDALIPLFSGSTVRDGESIGRRLSTIGYDFPASPGTNQVDLSGGFEIGSSVSGIITLPYDHPTNPFLHKYHPDHDNLNARFDGPAVEAFTTTRQIRLDFLSAPPEGPAVPDFGFNEMGGTYSETVTGLHKSPIHVSGTFRLTRVSSISELNPSPTF